MNDFPLLTAMQSQCNAVSNPDQAGAPGFVSTVVHWTDLDLLVDHYLESCCAALSGSPDRNFALDCAEEALRLHQIARRAEAEHAADAAANAGA